MSIDISPRLLRYFLAVAEELHFGRAAARLYISQPSLSHQIRRLEQALQTPLFVRSSRQVHLTSAGRTLLKEAPVALTALEQALEQTRLAGSGSAGTLRLGYTPVSSFGTFTVLLAALQEEHPDLTIDAREIFSAEIPERLSTGRLDVGLALAPQPFDGVGDEVLRREAVSALLSTRHRLAVAPKIPLAQLRDETLLLFPRRLAPAYYDGIVAACQEAGFSPDIRAFEDPPVNAMLARLSGGREVGLAPASFAEHAANLGSSLTVRDVVDPQIAADLSMMWPTTDHSPAVAGVLATARRCAERHGWLRGPVA
ncbi:LysR substrate-binding domain-containing protein [Myceligenerans xiligouense]|uniref:DNA-binding transcriptional LysR family regulator n=1 Tax=Myceligenerans xiligouense TaxID=253184 RepID=A0A3N4Z3Z7_9MICO|nr:LysR substrate-binding domain-containing protein [Myceligenerans xiligouense]RPF19902.1 DNA-binding transcriptional LysR family regulator [Myceligenerans xiligouense]